MPRLWHDPPVPDQSLVDAAALDKLLSRVQHEVETGREGVRVSFNLADLFETVVDADPDREVVVAGERRLTYRELDERANRLANYLAESGVGPDDPVGLQLANGTEYVEAMLAAFKLRAIPINVNYRYVERELRYLYDDSGIVALIYHRQFGVPVGKALVERPGMHSVLVVEDGSDVDVVQDADSYEDALTSASSDRPKVDGRSDDDLYLGRRC
jgi:acyl-CoA synthetase (AMP-forming)/AMP-acid ligase II